MKKTIYVNILDQKKQKPFAVIRKKGTNYTKKRYKLTIDFNIV